MKKEEYITMINNYLKELAEEDCKFLNQILTLLVCYIKKKKRGH